MAVRHFARLKLRVLGNGFRGQPWRIVLFVVGCVFGLWFAGAGFLLSTLAGVPDRPELALLVPVSGGAVVVLGWVLVPLVWAGVDETLDPARFALLPLPRRTLIAGLSVAAVLGIPAVATFAATAGLVVGAARLGGPVAALVQLAGVLLGLLLCVTASRAVTSAFSSLLRARRTRDLAAVVLAVLAALLGPLQIAVLAVLQRADPDQLLRIGEVVGATPLAAPYLIGFDVAAGRHLAALGRLALTAATIALVLWWWAGTLEAAMLGRAAGAGPRRRSRRAPGTPVTDLLGRLPRDRFGALVARELRYWWRDARRRASLITLAVLAAVIPLTGNLPAILGASDAPAARPPLGLLIGAMMMVGSLAAVTLANQFGFDGTAYAAHLVAAVPGRVELRARVAAFSIYMVPLLLLASVIAALVVGRPAQLPAMLGAVLAAYGAGLAVNLAMSVWAAYALPDTSNPFAINTGAGVAKSLLAMLALLGALVLAAPVAVAAVLLGGALSWLLLPVGLAYGAGAAWLGVFVVGDALDRRAPELLVAVTPGR